MHRMRFVICIMAVLLMLCGCIPEPQSNATTVDTSQATTMVFRAGEALTNISLTAMEFVDAGFVFSDTLYSLESLTPDKPLVLQVAFPGDLSCYGFICTDSQGITQLDKA